MYFEEKLRNAVIILIIVLICGFVGICFVPKQHLGYYLGVIDGRETNQIYPIFRIYNNWAYYPDTVVFESLSSNDCFEMFIKLKEK